MLSYVGLGEATPRCPLPGTHDDDSCPYLSSGEAASEPENFNVPQQQANQAAQEATLITATRLPSVMFACFAMKTSFAHDGQRNDDQTCDDDQLPASPSISTTPKTHQADTHVFAPHYQLTNLGPPSGSQRRLRVLPRQRAYTRKAPTRTDLFARTRRGTTAS